MSIKYKILPRKNPQNMMDPEKFYAAAIANGKINLDKLAQQISYQCRITESDCYAICCR